MSGIGPELALANKAILEQTRPAGAAAPTGSAARALWLSRLSVTDFRCYARAQIEADGRPVVLAGPNGAGKTNLLEAVSFLAPGRGLRRARLGDVDRRRAGTEPPRAWAVAATLMTPDGARDIGTGREPVSGNGHDANGRERRLVKIDGAFARSQQSLGEIVGMVWLTPQMDGLFREAATGRRRFLDRLVYGFDPAHAGRVAAYEQALRQRARLLKEGGADAAWLSALEDTMARHGIAIAAARRDLVARLDHACAAGVGPFPVAGLGLTGEVEAWLADGSALAVEDRMRTRLAEARAHDAAAGGAAVGPHRGDLSVWHRERDLPAEVCSTGEQKALLVSIVLAHARLLALHGAAAPVLLLDEIAAHLDETRRAGLFEEVVALGAQAWMTGTDAGVFADLSGTAQFFAVREARVEAAPAPAAGAGA
jgi:DNA replication and repair protein RecF